MSQFLHRQARDHAERRSLPWVYKSASGLLLFATHGTETRRECAIRRLAAVPGLATIEALPRPSEAP